jgi:diacylglycerol O-acyltransferase / wax synthase
MEHLGALDALFLHLETPETPMHVGSLMLLDRPRGRKGAFAAIRDHVAGRLHLVPVFNRKLGAMPLGITNPVWLPAGRLDLDYHFRRISLPAPGTQRQLEEAVARLHEGMLDRDRPLWQYTVIEGLAGGEVGLYAKIHHSALDGLGGIAVAQATLDTSPTAATRREKRPGRAPLAPSTARLLAAALRHTVAEYGSVLQAIPALAKAAARIGAFALTSPALRARGVALGPRTRLNAAIGAPRAFATARIPLAEAKDVARAFDGKVNDVVLAVCAGALRRHFAGDKAALRKAMIGAMPISLRSPGDAATHANRVTMMFVSLATNVADPVKRMRAIVAASTRAKTLAGGVKDAISAGLPSLGIPWLMAAVTPLYRKAIATDRIPVIANVTISNVPGPQVPLYLAGAELRAYYPVSIVTHGLALNITILSYDGMLHFGMVACRKAMPDLRKFARHLASAHRELARMAAAH